MSKQKNGITLRDAILSGKKFKRPSWDYWSGDDIDVIQRSTWGIENLTADDYILEVSEADKYRDMLDKQIRVLQYCQGHTSFMWAACISGIIMDVNFRDVTHASINNYINKIKESK